MLIIEDLPRKHKESQEKARIACREESLRDVFWRSVTVHVMLSSCERAGCTEECSQFDRESSVGIFHDDGKSNGVIFSETHSFGSQAES